MTTRTGILGGSFDPIHYGHLAIAEEARAALQLDRVLFIPAARQPFKSGAHAAPAMMRLEMARLACLGNDAFVASPIELERPGPSYTVATLEALAATSDDELFFILGSDALADFPLWHAAERIVELARIVAIGRPGFAPDTTTLFQALPALAPKLAQIEGPMLAISSTALRRRVAAGRPIRYQTPDPVAEYIAARRLYLDGAGTGQPE